MSIETIAARNKRIRELEARLETEEHAVSILTRSAQQWKERAEAAEEERDRLRKLFQHIQRELWMNECDVEWGDWEPMAMELKLLVLVPASDEFREEYGHDQMLVWAWDNDAEGESDAQE